MKITKTRLQQFINEALQKEGIGIRPQGNDDEPSEKSPKEELGSEVRACVAEQTDIILGDLKKVLEKWEEGEYDSDEERWQAYAKDIQGVIDEYEAATPIEFGHSKEECAEIHPDQSHEEWEKEKKPEKPKEKKEKKEKPSSEKKSSSGSKAKGPKLPPMTYESKLVDAVFGKLVSILPLKEE